MLYILRWKMELKDKIPKMTIVIVTRLRMCRLSPAHMLPEGVKGLMARKYRRETQIQMLFWSWLLGGNTTPVRL